MHVVILGIETTQGLLVHSALHDKATLTCVSRYRLPLSLLPGTNNQVIAKNDRSWARQWSFGEVDYIIPMNDWYADLLWGIQDELPLRNAYWHIDKSTYDRAINKWSFTDLCTSSGIQMPAIVKSVGEFEPGKMYIRKPFYTSGARGMVVAPAESWSEHHFLPETFIQEYIEESTQFKLTGFACCGQLISYHIFRKDFYYPLQGGSTTVGTYGGNDKLLKSAMALIQELAWTGIIDIDFIADQKSGAVYPIEVNPRLPAVSTFLKWDKSLLALTTPELSWSPDSITEQRTRKSVYLRLEVFVFLKHLGLKRLKEVFKYLSSGKMYFQDIPTRGYFLFWLVFPLFFRKSSD